MARRLFTHGTDGHALIYLECDADQTIHTLWCLLRPLVGVAHILTK